MSTAVPVLTTDRLIVRPFVTEDLDRIDAVLTAAWSEADESTAEPRAARDRWLRWTVSGYEELELLTQPPYGDRAIVLRDTEELVGSVGFVPLLAPFGQLPGFPDYAGSSRWFPEFGMFWAVDPAHQGRGYASEAARVMIDFALDAFNLGRICAGTTHDNHASMGVMRNLGMRILRNPLQDPPWFQVVGVLEPARM